MMWTNAALYLHYKSAKDLFADLAKNPDLMNDCIGTFKALETLGIGEDYEHVKTRGQKTIREIAEIEAVIY